ncbi:MAG: hypothetical protein IPF54_00705 [Draconibacterium sp.]|nr:hypothetical protein [Draconibacterium sp.]
MKKLIFLIIIISLNTRGYAQEISPYLFGQNHWMATGDEGSRIGYLDLLWPKVKASGIKMVRIGGIGYEDRFPNDQRLTAMIDSIRSIGAEPLVQVPRDISNEDVSRLIKEFKYSNGKGIRFYSIGNEPICNELEKFDEVHEYLTRLCPVMKAADPTIKILVFDACTFYEEEYAALCGGRLDITGKDKNGNWMIDGFTFHNYPNGREFERHNVVFSGPKSIERQVQLLVEMMESANKKHGRTGKEELVWGPTETNVTYANPNREISGYGNPSFLGGQFIAEMYGIGMKYGAFTVNPWCISETDRISSDFGYIGLPSEFYPRSSYYHTQMMAENMKGEFLETECSNSYVKTIASISEDELCVMILNEDQFNDYDFELVLNEDSNSKKALVIRADLDLDKTIRGTSQIKQH